MISQTLRALMRQTPFRPFAIRMLDGQVIPVRHPEMLIVSPGGSVALTFIGPERPKIIPLDQVEMIECGTHD